MPTFWDCVGMRMEWLCNDADRESLVEELLAELEAERAQEVAA